MELRARWFAKGAGRLQNGRMPMQFTPAAERAFQAAAAWAGSNGPAELAAPEVLLGLLAEPECRGAMLLAGYGVDEPAVMQRWPELVRLEVADPVRAGRFSPAVMAALRAAEQRLFEYPRPLMLATEHILLGLAAGRDEVAAWLTSQGVQADALEAEIHRLSGHQAGPLPLDVELPEEAEPIGKQQSRQVIPDLEQPVELEAERPDPAEQVAALRVIDAAANRAGEGLRVVEDYLRFVLDDRHLTEKVKAIRHDLTDVLSIFDSVGRHAARETLADVGVEISLPAEQRRRNLAAVASASFSRIEQALRSLEEFVKTIDAAAGMRLEQLRYRVYTLERAVSITRDSLERLAAARLYVLVDGRESVEEFARLAGMLVREGVSVIQLRDKRLPDRELLERARELRRLTRGSRTLFIMNDRPDLALLAEADGVHLGQDDATVNDARRVLGTQALIGVSTHSLEQAQAAVLAGANYIGVGPTFPSGTKQFAQFTGLDLLRSVASSIRLPSFAIGGIGIANLDQVRGTGSERVAVSGAILTAADQAAAVRELRQKLPTN